MKTIEKYKIDVTLGNATMSKISKWLPLFYISEKLRKGFREEIELREGLKIIINEYKPKRNLVIDFSINKAPCEFAICLSGRMKVEFSSKNESYHILDISKGSAAFFYLPDTNGVMTVYANETLKIISLHCTPEFISNFFDDNRIPLSSSSVNLNSKIAEIPTFLEFTKANNRILGAANQICENNFSGASKKMFIEAKALELMTYIIDGIKTQNNENNPDLISQAEIQKANQVSNLLKMDLSEVPSLSQLADKVGLTHTRLNKAFRQVYGTTVFEYLRELRLEKARELLEKNDTSLNITDIAYDTGWSSPSHFSREFLKRYNITPKAFSKSIKKQ